MLRLPFESSPELLAITTEKERALCQKHFELLQDWNTRMALVSRKSIDKSFESHYADSIYIARFAHSFYKGGMVYDLGSGAGFPGVFFAIRYPDVPVVLFERVQKKNKFLQEVVSQLGLGNVQVQGEWRNEWLEGLFLARAVTPRVELFQFLETRVRSESVVILNSGSEADTTYIPGTFRLKRKEVYTLPGQAGSRQIEAFYRVPRGT